MGILNPKTRVIDFVLTDKGRELLSKNKLNFKYYAFSDEGIDYSGSLSASIEQSASFDNFIHRNLTFEANQRKSKDLSTFLYTAPNVGETLPEMTISINTGSAVTLKRSYVIDSTVFESFVGKRIEQPLAAIAKVTYANTNEDTRSNDYISEQHIVETLRLLEAGQNVIGRFIGKNQLIISPNEILNLDNNFITRLDPSAYVSQLPENYVLRKNDILDIEKDVELVIGLDEQKVSFSLKDDSGDIEPTKGFLIEIYDSGSDGKITKLKRKDLTNILDDSVIRQGFENFIDIKVDEVDENE